MSSPKAKVASVKLRSPTAVAKRVVGSSPKRTVPKQPSASRAIKTTPSASQKKESHPQSASAPKPTVAKKPTPAVSTVRKLPAVARKDDGSPSVAKRIMPFPWPASTPASVKSSLPACINNLALGQSVDDAFDFAGKHLELRSAMAAKPAVVLDLDDSVLVKEPQRPSPAAQRFYKLALKHKVAVFFVTARPEESPADRAATVKQLKQNGYGEYEKLYMAPRYTQAFSGIKASCRKDIESNGWTIIVNAGDQWADLIKGTGNACLAQLDVLDAIAKKKPILFFNSGECGALAIKLPYA